jgi:predicted permease
MSLPERLLRLALGAYKASALLGDLEEEAARVGASRAWIRRQAWRYAVTAAGAAVVRTKSRMLTTIYSAGRDTWRSVRRFSASTVMAFVILASSIGAGTMTFSFVDPVVLRPLPYPEPNRLVVAFGATPRNSRDMHVSPADYFTWRDSTTAFEELAAWMNMGSVTVSHSPASEQIGVTRATANLFRALRVQPIVGTAFRSEHEVPGRDDVALISHRLWQQQFGGATDIVGRPFRTSRGLLTVIGVMPPSFVFPADRVLPSEIWRPLAIQPDERTISAASGRSRYVQVVGRLRDGVTLDLAHADVERVTRHLATSSPQHYVEWRVRTGTMLDVLTERVRGWMLLVLCAVALVIATACANVANLLLTRGTARRKDIAIRTSLGATRGQIACGLLFETLMLSLTAAAAGVVLAYWGLETAKAALPTGIPRAATIALDLRVVVVAAGASVATALAFGIGPALQASHVNPSEMLRDSGRAHIGHLRYRWRSALLIAQVALVTMLLAATTLLVGSLIRALNADLGFNREGLLAARVTPALPPDGPLRDAARREFYGRLEKDLREIPGITHVATVMPTVPLYRDASSSTRIFRAARTDVDPIVADMRRVSIDYFATLGIQIGKGRQFSEGDRRARVAILDELAAGQLFGTTDALDSLIVLGNRDYRIIGVAKTVWFLGPEEAPLPQLYLPLDVAPSSTMTVVVRTSLPIERAAPVLEAQLGSMMPAGTAAERVEIQVMDTLFRQLTADRRFNAGLIGAIGVLAFIIGIAGIYGVTASTVAQQTREIGIRMALGASATRVVRSVTWTTSRLLLIGTVLGLVGAWVLSDVLRSVVFGIQPTDVIVYAVPAVFIAAGGLVAAFVPTRRAARIDPLIALRSE